MESCRVLSKITDFTFDNSTPSMIYALTDKKEVVLFELSTQRNKCTAIGKISLDQNLRPSAINFWNGSLLSITNEDSVTVIDMPAVPSDFVVASNRRAEYPMPVC